MTACRSSSHRASPLDELATSSKVYPHFLIKQTASFCSAQILPKVLSSIWVKNNNVKALCLAITAALFGTATRAAPPSIASHAAAQRAPDDVFNSSKVVGFWGQSSQDLSDVCDKGNFDIVIMGFVTSLSPPRLNLGSNVGAVSPAQSRLATQGWGLVDATTVARRGKTSVAAQVQACQRAGKLVLISFGGTKELSQASFGSREDAVRAASFLWHLFLGGTDMANLRPFGSDVVLDGVDMDNETGDGSYYDDFAQELRSYFASASRKYYLSADPVCGAVGDGNDTSIPASLLPKLDFLNVQFYNDDQQGLGTDGFARNLRQWDRLLSSVKPSPRLFVGIPGGEGATHDEVAVQNASEISRTIADVKNMNLLNFGGMMVWDIGYAENNTGFAEAVKGAL